MATIVSSSTSYPIASHIPLIEKGGKLIGHFAKANKHVQHLKDNEKLVEAIEKYNDEKE